MGIFPRSTPGPAGLRHLSAARSAYEEVAAFYTEHLGKDCVHTLGIRGTLTGVLATLGELSAARKIFEEVVAGLAGKVGPRHAMTRKVVDRLGHLVALMARKERESSSRV